MGSEEVMLRLESEVTTRKDIRGKAVKAAPVFKHCSRETYKIGMEIKLHTFLTF
jgi:hypothetical protein